eukprot:COSAG05_NODE_1707_length_4242_cov_9.508086_8_plen_65_part_00
MIQRNNTGPYLSGLRPVWWWLAAYIQVLVNTMFAIIFALNDIVTAEGEWHTEEEVRPPAFLAYV